MAEEHDSTLVVWFERVTAGASALTALSMVQHPIALSCDGVIVFVNDSAKALLAGKSGESPLGVRLLQFVEAQSVDLVASRLRQSRELGSLPPLRLPIVTLDGRHIEVESTSFVYPVKVDGRSILVTILTDHTELLTRSETERQLLQLFEQLSDAILVVDEGGHVVMANDQAGHLFAAEVTSLVGTVVEQHLADPVAKAHHADFRKEFASHPSRRLMRGSPLAVIRTADGREIPVEVGLAPLTLKDQLLVVASIRDVSARIEADRQLRASESQYRALFQESQVGIFVADASGRYIDVNPAGCRMVGYSRDELCSMHLADLLVPDDLVRQPLAIEALTTDRLLITERSLRCKDGTLIPVEISGSRLPNGNVQGLVRDLSERRRHEETIRQAMKLDAVGRLAGGVAHDFNNILTVILSISNALHSHVSDDEGVSLLAELEEAGNRAAELTKQLLTFARRQPAQPRVLDFNEQIRRFSKFLARTLGEDVELELRLAPMPLFARIDLVHLEQILLNLAVNAREAMPRGGSLIIVSRVQGTRLCVEVTDTGLGMAPDVIAHLFEPFFTTKERGRGTGLGLATVYGIVQQNEGELAVTSTPGQGSTFTLSFPLAVPEVENARAPTPSPLRVGLSILVVEDDVSVRESLRRLLERDGHRVFAVGTLDAALDVVRANTGLDLLITDVVMPGAGGKLVAEAIRAQRPSLPVLFVSGYAPDAEELAALGDCLSKPFSPDMLRNAVARAMRHH